MNRLTLRAVDATDAYPLWVWANDPETRRAAHDRDIIPWRAHVDWLATQMASDAAHAWIGLIDHAQPAGSIRFDTKDDWKTGRLSYVVAPELRGHGLGAMLVAAGVEALRAVHATVAIIADVRANNEPSLRVFRRYHWTESAHPDSTTVRFVYRQGEHTR